MPTTRVRLGGHLSEVLVLAISQHQAEDGWLLQTYAAELQLGVQGSVP